MTKYCGAELKLHDILKSLCFRNSSSSTDPEDEMTVHQYVGKWESVTPFAANQSAAKTNDKNTAGQTGMVMLQVWLLEIHINRNHLEVQ